MIAHADNKQAKNARHPAPHRDRISLNILLFGLFGAPVAWLGQLIVNFALASHACFSASMSRSRVLPGWEEIWFVLLLINIAAIMVALIAAATSYRNWHSTKEEHPSSSEALLETGEGRTRFMAASGIMTGLVFLIAILFDTIALFVVPQCAN
jgi:uncharacterized membrane protein YeiB